jgi:prolyl oligopeptidase
VRITLSLFAAIMAMANGQTTDTKLEYPPTRKGDVVEDYHGTKVADPYRWLEDDNSVDTKAWVESQNNATFGYLATIPGRDRIKDRLTKLWNYEKYGAPGKEGGRYFYSHNTGLQNQFVLYTTKELKDRGHVLMDPNTLSTDGTVALGPTSVSDDGKLFAYAIQRSGSDWQEWRVRDVDTAKDLDDHVQWAKFTGAAWTNDNKGFFYSRYDAPKSGEELTKQNFFQKLHYHRIGTPQSEDVLVYERPDHKEWGFGGLVTEDGRYLVVSVWRGTDPTNRIFYKDLNDPKRPALGKETPVVELLPAADAKYDFVGNDGPVFWFYTDKGAPRHKLVAIDTRTPEPERWRELISQAQDSLESVSVVGDRFFARYLKDAHAQVKLFALDGKPLGDVALPGIGSVAGFGGKRKDKETFYTFTGFTTPPTIYRYDVPSRKSEVFRKAAVAFEPDQYETKEIFYNSKDGTRVPMFITHKKGIKLDGSNPTILYGYGGFNSPMTPWFSVSNAVWMEMGGVYAAACIRGGGEYGQAWHDAGRLKNRQNVFDDFIAAGEWLIANGYTSNKKLAIQGGSNGGLLVGACMTQRPDLFAAALPAVGVMDMLRFQKFTIGWAWTSDYGSSDNAEDFKTLLAYSPLHNIRSGTKYPATLVTTSDHDDRVVPAHSYKFTAALQAAQAGDKPVLIRVETKAGHGGGKPTAKIIDEVTDTFAFLTRVLDMHAP